MSVTMDEEKPEYYYRLVCLVVDVGTDVLLKLFLKSIPSNYTLETFLKSKSSEFKALNKKKVLTNMQKDIIETADATLFDISLLYVLIRSLTKIQAPTNGWDAVCLLPGDESPGVFVNKLKDMRNKAIAHRPKAALQKSKFECFWNETEYALMKLASEIPSESVAIQQRIDDAKTKALVGDEDNRLDALLKWNFEDQCSKLSSKLDEVKAQIDSQGNMKEEICSMKSSLSEIKDQFTRLGINDNQSQMLGANDVPDGPSTQHQVGQVVVRDGRAHPNTEVERLSLQVHRMENMLQQFIQQQYYMLNTRPMAIPGIPVAPVLPRITNPNALTDNEIQKFSQELGGNWEIFASFLGFSYKQADRLKVNYPHQIEAMLYQLILRWHEVVARCDNENPRKLLAAAFSQNRDNQTAIKILGDRKLLAGVKTLKPKSETEEKIQKIIFGPHTTNNPTVNIGGHNSLNVFPDASLSIGGNVNLASASFPYSHHPQPFGSFSLQNYQHQLSSRDGAHAMRFTPYQQPCQPTILPPSNYCRGEGIGGGDQIDGSKPQNDTSQFKRESDETLTETDMDILTHSMKSVGCLVTPNGRGTAFRVGDRFVITAMHIVESVQVEWYQQYRPNTSLLWVYLNFNESLDHPSTSLYALHPPCFTDRELDVAILEIANPNYLLPGPLSLSKIEGPKSRVSIIGYGHPGTNHNHLDPNCQVLTANSNRVMKAISQVCNEAAVIRENLKNPEILDSAFIGYDAPSRFLLDSFFEHGGSGGPAIDHEIPASAKVVGIYVKGFPQFFFDLPQHLQCKYRSDCRFEMCTRTSSLYSVLAASDEQFANRIFG